MAYNYNKLRGRIKEKCDTQEIFANKMKMSRTAISQRLNNKIEFSQNEIVEACKILDIQQNDIPLYFFCVKVWKSKHFYEKRR